MLELVLHVKQGALLVVLLMWRMGRIIHGLVTTIEIGHKKVHAKINKVLLAQLQKKAADMNDLKQRFADLNNCRRDLDNAETLLKPTALTLENVDNVPLAELQRNCKLQIINNREVHETLSVLRADLRTLEGHIDGHLEDALRQSAHASLPHSKTKGLEDKHGEELDSYLAEHSVSSPSLPSPGPKNTFNSMKTIG